MRQKSILESKRQVHEEIKPCFIWVFYNKSWIFGGWWVYLKTIHEDYAINFKNPNEAKLLKIIMNMYPCGTLPMIENFEQWAEAFEKTFHREAFKRKKNAIKSCYCKIRYGHDIVDVAKNIETLKNRE